MYKIFNFVLCVFVLFHILYICCAITNENSETLNEFRYCLRRSTHSNFKECVGRTAISFLQRFDERDNFTVSDTLIVSRDESAASRSLVNFLDTDPVDFRGILENAGAVFSQRALEFHMDTIYPGLMFKIGPSADSNSVAQFILDPAANERNLNYEEPSTARILTKQYILPFLLGLKFNLVALVPILFTIICLLLKKSLFIAKLVIYISSILGIGGVAGSFGTFSGWDSFFGHGHGFGVGAGGIPPHHHHDHVYGGENIAGGFGLHPEKNTIYSQYDPDDLERNAPYKRQDRKVVFEKTRENNVHSTVEPILTVASATDRFYEYEKQMLMQDHSAKPRQAHATLSPFAYSEDAYKEVNGLINLSPSIHRFQTSDNSGWTAVNLRP